MAFRSAEAASATMRKSVPESNGDSIVAQAAVSEGPLQTEDSGRAAQLRTIHQCNNHVYKDIPLQSHSQNIRVLVLNSSARRSEKLECSLKIAPLNSKYRALSYTWGDECDTVPMIVNGLQFEITRNLAAALRRIRLLRPTRKTVLWVHAVCINQGSDMEKNIQLRRMRRIYAGALKTLVWLGEGTPETNRAMTYFGKIGEKDEVDEDQLIRDYEDNKLAWSGLGDIMLREFFRRLWIVQEVIVSDPVVAVCGKLCLSFYTLTRMMAIAMSHGLDISSVNHAPLSPYQRNIALIEYFRDKYRAGDFLPLRYWLSNYAVKHTCRDDRDRVFAVLALASDRHAPGLASLDYGDSANNTYEVATRHILSTGVDLDFICLGRGPTRTDEQGFPSWVPDLRLKSHLSAATLSRNLYLPGNDYAAAGRDFSPYDDRIAPNTRYFGGVTHEDGPIFLESGKVLVTPGVWVDSIKDVGHTYFHRMLHIDEAQYLHHGTILEESIKMAQHCTAGNLAFEPYVKGEGSYLEAFSRTLSCDRNASDRRCLNGEGFFPYKEYRASGKPLETFIMDTSPTPDEIEPHALHRVGRRFMVSDGGLMGMVPREARPGDDIFILFGCSVPVVLRKAEGTFPRRMEHRTFVGDW